LISWNNLIQVIKLLHKAPQRNGKCLYCFAANLFMIIGARF